MDLEKEVTRIKARVEQNHLMLKSIRRHMRIQAAFGTLKLILIAIPIILALIYIPELVRQYQEMVNTIKGGAFFPTLPQGLDIGGIQDVLKNTGITER